MKSLIKILSRYVLSATSIGFLLLLVNIMVFIAYGIKVQKEAPLTNGHIHTIASGLIWESDKFSLNKDAQQALDSYYSWAMLLDDDGNVIWSNRLPESFPHTYTSSDIASFSRWYLRGYPVNVWKHSQGLLVLGSAQDSEWKYLIVAPERQIKLAIAWLPWVLFLNLAVALMIALLLGLRLFAVARPLAQGIADLAEGKPVHIPVKGVLSTLAKDINCTSNILIEQKELLHQRDHTRTTWIAGVSHDIRTPLSMVMGYAGQLEENKTLPDIIRAQAGIIRKQSERIRALISDLNLASKLMYQLEPIRPTILSPAALLRKAAADILNNNLAESFSLSLEIAPDLERLCLTGDERLLVRALQNLIQNSIIHNPDGCEIRLSLTQDEGEFTMIVQDNGVGYPEPILKRLRASEKSDNLPTHGLGLVIVKQITTAHGGKASFCNTYSGACSMLTFPKGIEIEKMDTF